jgi:hypothetical protein
VVKKPIVAVIGLLAAAMTLSSPAWAGRDPLLQMAEQEAREAQAKLQQAETAKAAERERLMGEHVGLLDQALQDLMKAKPKAGVSASECEGWISDHQKLMEGLLQQMIQEHKLMQETPK